MRLLVKMSGDGTPEHSRKADLRGGDKKLLVEMGGCKTPVSTCGKDPANEVRNMRTNLPALQPYKADLGEVTRLEVGGGSDDEEWTQLALSALERSEYDTTGRAGMVDQIVAGSVTDKRGTQPVVADIIEGGGTSILGREIIEVHEMNTIQGVGEDIPRMLGDITPVLEDLRISEGVPVARGGGISEVWSMNEVKDGGQVTPVVDITPDLENMKISEEGGAINISVGGGIRVENSEDNIQEVPVLGSDDTKLGRTVFHQEELRDVEDITPVLGNMKIYEEGAVVKSNSSELVEMGVSLTVGNANDIPGVKGEDGRCTGGVGYQEGRVGMDEHTPALDSTPALDITEAVVDVVITKGEVNLGDLTVHGVGDQECNEGVSGNLLCENTIQHIPHPTMVSGCKEVDNGGGCSYVEGVCRLHGPATKKWRGGKVWGKKKNGLYGWVYGRKDYYVCEGRTKRQSDRGDGDKTDKTDKTVPTFIYMGVSRNIDVTSKTYSGGKADVTRERLSDSVSEMNSQPVARHSRGKLSE